MKYNGQTNISYKNIILLLKDGIKGNTKNRGSISFAHEGGEYLGCPGKELFFSLPSLSEAELKKVACKLSSSFPKKPPKSHVKWAACIRYIYGCFEKQGCLRSKADKIRLTKEGPDWSLSTQFMEIVASYFKKNNNNYGLVLHYEMFAHRCGDLSIIDPGNKENLQLMLKYYLMSQKLAVKIKSWKHTFTPFYWAAYYFYDNKDYKNSAIYHKKNLQAMENYCPDARDGYREKAQMSMKQLKKCLSTKDYKKHCKWFRRCKNKCLKKIKVKLM